MNHQHCPHKHSPVITNQKANTLMSSLDKLFLQENTFSWNQGAWKSVFLITLSFAFCLTSSERSVYCLRVDNPFMRFIPLAFVRRGGAVSPSLARPFRCGGCTGPQTPGSFFSHKPSQGTMKKRFKGDFCGVSAFASWQTHYLQGFRAAYPNRQAWGVKYDPGPAYFYFARLTYNPPRTLLPQNNKSSRLFHGR